MQKLLSILDDKNRFCWYENGDIAAFLHKYKLDGFELVYYDESALELFPRGVIKGLHLPFYADYVPFYRQEWSYLLQEFGSRAQVESFYGGITPKALVEFYVKPLRYAAELGVDYVVFHVGQVNLRETFTFNCAGEDMAVCEATASLLADIKRELDKIQTWPSPYFLMENLFWPGLNLHNAAVTAKMLQICPFEPDGIAFDTGHLMCENQSIMGCMSTRRWFAEVLQAHDSLIDKFITCHLHQSQSSLYAVQGRCNAPDLSPDLSYLENFARSYEHVLNIDQHEVFRMPWLDWLLDYIKPKYLVYEFRYDGQAEMLKKLRAQNEFVAKAMA